MLEAERLLHQLWGKAKDCANYDKQEWLALQKEIQALAQAVPCIIEYSSPSAPPPKEVKLSPREKQVLYCLDKGVTYKEIGLTLGISTNTVRTYVRTLYRKLEVHNKAGAIAEGKKLL